MQTVEARAVLKKGEGRLLKSGGWWVFDNELERVEGRVENGAILPLFDFDGYPMGFGMLSLNSRIRLRMLTRNAGAVIDRDFFKARIKAAWDYRKAVTDTSSCRLIFGEADFLPGLTVDKYEDVLVMEPLSFGMDLRKRELVELLAEVLMEDGIKIRGVYERSDAKERSKEGLPRTKGFLTDPFDTEVEITENGVHYLVDVADGQKTGFFLDQKYNRRAIHSLARGARVLDFFTHTGSFALNAALAGAADVLALDASESALAMASRNALLNGYAPGPLTEEAQIAAEGTNVIGSFRSADGRALAFAQTDILEYLPELPGRTGGYDLVILDPPAFAKARDNVKNAERAYRKINRIGMQLVRNGGYLATCSCSHFMTRELFERMLLMASKEAHVRLRQVEARTQGPDHPILWASDETSYLKFYIFQVVIE